MIKGLVGGRGISVTGSGSTSFPYVPMNINNPIQGMIRINGQDLQVFDGSSWLTMSTSYSNIELDADTQALLEWARKKRAEEYEREQLAQTNPAIKDLVNQIKEKEEQIKMVQTLIKSPGNEPQELMGS